jgi:hypothetical protein
MYIKKMIHLLITGSLSDLQQCQTVKDAYQKVQCCDASPMLGVPDATVFPPWDTRRTSVTFTDRVDTNYSSIRSTGTDILMAFLPRKEATVADYNLYSGSLMPQKIKDIGYRADTLAHIGGADMVESEYGSGVGKAIIVFGGGFAVESCMSFVRTGGHCYFGSRTAGKQDRIKQSITEASFANKQWSTARLWTEVTSAQVGRLYMHDLIGTVDLRNPATIATFLGNVKAHALTNSLSIKGVFLASGSTRLPPDVYKVGASSPSVDMTAHPDFFTNTDPWKHPDQFVNHYYSNLYLVDAMGAAFPPTEATDMTFVFTGSAVTLSDAASSNSVKHGYSPLTSTFDNEYTQARKLVQEVRRAAMKLGFKTNVVHPAACATDWWSVLSTGSLTFFPIMYGVTTTSSQTTDLAAAKLLSVNNKENSDLTTIDANTRIAHATNLQTYWSSAEGTYLLATVFGGLSVAEITGMITGLTMKELFPDTYNAIAPGMGLPTGYTSNVTKWPRAARITAADVYQMNDYQFITFIRLVSARLPPPLQSLFALIDAECVAQMGDEAFCSVSGESYAVLSAIFPVLATILGIKTSPLSPPFMVGMAAANAVMKGTTNHDMYQYAFFGAGDIMTNKELQTSHMGTGNDEQDKNLLALILDLSSTSAQNRRYVHNTTTSTSVWV